MGLQKAYPLALLVLLCAGVGAQAQGLQSLLDAVNVLPEKCQKPVTNLALFCLDEIQQALKVFGIEKLTDIAKLAEVDFSKKGIKKKLAGLADEVTIGEKCCTGVEGLKDKKCGCEPKIKELVEAFGQEEVITELVKKFKSSCEVEIGFITIEDSCPKPEKD